MALKTDDRFDALHTLSSSDAIKVAMSVYCPRFRVKQSSRASMGFMLNNERKKLIATGFVLTIVARDVLSPEVSVSNRYPKNPSASTSCADRSFGLYVRQYLGEHSHLYEQNLDMAQTYSSYRSASAPASTKRVIMLNRSSLG